VKLSPKEYELLRVLVQHAGKVLGTHAATLRDSLSAAQFHGKSSSSLWMA
jgi:DNA-binding response OmpR family regulator